MEKGAKVPTALIEVRQQYTPEQEVALITALHQAMQQALKLPDWDRNVRLLVHAPHRFACPPDKSAPERYTLVTIHMFSGRSIAAKRALYRTIVEGLETCGIPPDHVLISLVEIAPENWGVRGGQPASEVDIGFRIDV
jgi:phenylpyruvate tautomerase PptA (4-oxalocrotonate tautomerase family)